MSEKIKKRIVKNAKCPSCNSSSIFFKLTVGLVYNYSYCRCKDCRYIWNYDRWLKENSCEYIVCNKKQEYNYKIPWEDQLVGKGNLCKKHLKPLMKIDGIIINKILF